MAAKVLVHPSDVTDQPSYYVAKPTRWTVSMRTFLPYQAWRFVVINLRMLELIVRSHRSHPPATS